MTSEFEGWELGVITKKHCVMVIIVTLLVGH